MSIGQPPALLPVSGPYIFHALSWFAPEKMANNADARENRLLLLAGGEEIAISKRLNIEG